MYKAKDDTAFTDHGLNPSDNASYKISPVF